MSPEAAEHALDLTERYVTEVALPSLKEAMPESLDFVAIGLVGNGSDCFGYDDELSRDHDWGVDFYIWIPEDKAEYALPLAKWKEDLFATNPPKYIRNASEYGAKTSVLGTRDFYRMLIGTDSAPDNVRDWIRIPEDNLAMAVNGRIYYDGPGEFTNIREQLLRHYPDDLRLKRIATACMLAAQAGQYNFPRIAKRGDVPTMQLCIQRFVDQVEKIAFLLNRRYRPYYKWRYRALGELPILGKELSHQIDELCSKKLTDPEEVKEAERIMEDVCLEIEAELKKSGLSDAKDSYLQPHGESVFERLQDPWLKSLPITFEV